LDPSPVNFSAPFVGVQCGAAFTMAIDKLGNAYSFGEVIFYSLYFAVLSNICNFVLELFPSTCFVHETKIDDAFEKFFHRRDGI
jgi:alpha-tubulin suppressor-like RCC1 family protein